MLNRSGFSYYLVLALFFLAAGCGDHPAATAAGKSTSPTPGPLSNPKPSVPSQEKDYQERLREQIDRLPTKTKYSVSPWGLDGNPARQSAESAKTLCIYDDISADYVSCRTKNSTHCAENSRKQFRCVWLGGRCEPDTLRRCGNLLPQSVGAYKKVVGLSEMLQTWGSLRGFSFEKEFSNYRNIEVHYFGHGPDITSFAKIAAEVVKTANLADNIEVQTWGCSTFAPENSPADKLSYYFLLSDEAIERLPKMNVTITGNQLFSYFGETMEGLTPITFKLQPGAKRSVKFVEKEWYECSSNNLEHSISHRARHCDKDEANLGAYCLQNGERTKEYCRPFELYDTFPRPERGYARAKKPSVEYREPAFPSENSALWYGDQKGAADYCAAHDQRLPTFWELKEAMEYSNLHGRYRTTGWLTGRTLLEGNLWSSSLSPKGYAYVYPLNWVRDGGKAFDTLRVSSSAFVFCVNK